MRQPTLLVAIGAAFRHTAVPLLLALTLAGVTPMPAQITFPPASCEPCCDSPDPCCCPYFWICSVIGDCDDGLCYDANGNPMDCDDCPHDKYGNPVNCSTTPPGTRCYDGEGNPIPCPPECFDKYGNPTPCPPGPCVHPDCPTCPLMSQTCAPEQSSSSATPQFTMSLQRAPGEPGPEYPMGITGFCPEQNPGNCETIRAHILTALFSDPYPDNTDIGPRLVVKTYDTDTFITTRPLSVPEQCTCGSKVESGETTYSCTVPASQIQILTCPDLTTSTVQDVQFQVGDYWSPPEAVDACVIATVKIRPMPACCWDSKMPSECWWYCEKETVAPLNIPGGLGYKAMFPHVFWFCDSNRQPAGSGREMQEMTPGKADLFLVTDSAGQVLYSGQVPGVKNLQERIRCSAFGCEPDNDRIASAHDMWGVFLEGKHAWYKGLVSKAVDPVQYPLRHSKQNHIPTQQIIVSADDGTSPVVATFSGSVHIRIELEPASQDVFRVVGSLFVDFNKTGKREP